MKADDFIEAVRLARSYYSVLRTNHNHEYIENERAWITNQLQALLDKKNMVDYK